MYFCYNMISAKDLVTRDQEVGPGPSVLVTSLPNARVLEAILGVHLLDDVYIATKILWLLLVKQMTLNLFFRGLFMSFVWTMEFN